MGEPNMGIDPRDLIAEIICNAMTPSQRSGGISEKHYVVADAVLAAIGSLDATGDALMRISVIVDSVAVIAGSARDRWFASATWSPERRRHSIMKSGHTPLAAITAALAAAEAGR